MTVAKRPGWYPDPSGGRGQRFWDGDSWTAYELPLPPATAADPVPRPAEEDYPYLAQDRESPARVGGWTFVPTWSRRPGPGASPSTWEPLGPGAVGGPAPTPSGDAAIGAPTTSPSGRAPASAGQQRRRGRRRAWLWGTAALAALALSALVFILATRQATEPAGSGSDPAPAPGPAAELAWGSTAATIPAGGAWLGSLTLSQDDVVVVDVRAENGRDVAARLLDDDGQEVWANDDRGAALFRVVGGEVLDPFGVLDLQAGDHTLELREVGGRAADVEISVLADLGSLVEPPGLSPITTGVGEWAMVHARVEPGAAVVDVRATGHGPSSDPLAAIITPNGRVIEADDRTAELIAQVGGSERDPYAEVAVRQTGLLVVIVADYHRAALAADVAITAR